MESFVPIRLFRVRCGASMFHARSIDGRLTCRAPQSTISTLGAPRKRPPAAQHTIAIADRRLIASSPHGTPALRNVDLPSLTLHCGQKRRAMRSSTNSPFRNRGNNSMTSRSDKLTEFRLAMARLQTKRSNLARDIESAMTSNGRFQIKTDYGRTWLLTKSTYGSAPY